MDMLLTGQPISAQRAWQLGLVNRVVPTEELDACIEEYIDAIRSTPAEVIRLGKAAFYDQLALDETKAYQRATEIITDNALRHEAQEGISAFLQKRPPNWKE
jgi:enoyl-CoA hydratase/carnithine racemase